MITALRHFPRGLHLAALLWLAPAISAQQASPTSPGALEAAYRRGMEFGSINAMSRVRNALIVPRWTGEGDRFWYERQLDSGSVAVLIDPDRNTRTEPFDRSTLPPPRQTRPDESLSPDGRWAAFQRNHNLWVRSTDTNQEVQLTQDGVRDLAYGGRGEGFQGSATARRLNRKLPPAVVWSPDSRRLIAQKIDQRGVRELYMVESRPATGDRPRVFGYRMPFSADDTVTVAHLLVFEVATRRMTPIAAAPLYVLHASPIDFQYVWWSRDGTKAYFIRESRGAKELELTEVDPETGAARPILKETSPTFADLFVDYYSRLPGVSVLGGGAEVVWLSARDGWGHLYLYDGRTGAVKGQVTRGDFAVHGIVRVDESARAVYFIAGGREPGRNPYYRHLYRVNLDGSGLTLLTPENADHRITMAPSGRHFIDGVSRPDTIPTFLLRSADGKVVRTLERGDVSRLTALGWRWPEPFRTRAADGATDIYGLIYRPTDFDPTRRYPVIDDIYPGPQTTRTPIAFPGTPGEGAWYWTPQTVAELGFIVVTMDGRGTPGRSKRFHDVAYRNLGDAGGIDDHIESIRQLAGRYWYLDTTRVGIYGASSGGYAAIRAMLTRPSFFDVGVAAVPYLGPSAIVAWWSDRYQGYPVDTANYRQNDLTPFAGNLQGKLLIGLGGLDENADPFLAMPLIDAFVKANKEFDLVLLPTVDHAASGHPYFLRKRFDFFVRHLLGAEPPDPNRRPRTIQ